LSLSSARFLAFASRGSAIGKSKVFCLFGGGGRVEGDRPESDAVGFCGVGAFGDGPESDAVDFRGVGGRDWYLGEEPPIEFLLAYIKAEEQGYLTYNGGPFG
jgi:hypothetical protein